MAFPYLPPLSATCSFPRCLVFLLHSSHSGSDVKYWTVQSHKTLLKMLLLQLTHLDMFGSETNANGIKIIWTWRHPAKEIIPFYYCLAMEKWTEYKGRTHELSYGRIKLLKNKQCTHTTALLRSTTTGIDGNIFSFEQTRWMGEWTKWSIWVYQLNTSKKSHCRSRNIYNKAVAHYWEERQTHT